MGDVRLEVDWILCDGYGLCGDLIPDLIGLDDWRYPILDADAVGRERLHDAQRAVDCCPMKALRLEPITAARPYARPRAAQATAVTTNGSEDTRRRQ